MLGSPGTRLLAITRLRVAPLVERVLRRAMPARVQRIGTRAMERVVERFPAMGELLQGALARVERALGPKPGARAPVESRGAPPSTTVSVSPVSTAIQIEVLVRQLQGPDWRMRADAASRLGELREHGIEDALHRALRDDSAEVAAAAAVSLSRLGTHRALAALREVLENRDGYFSPVTRAACVHGLAYSLDASLADDTGLVAGREAESVLDAVQDVDAEVSIAAILASSERMPQLATPRLLSVLADDTSYFLPLVRLAAANALSRMGTLSHDTLASLLHHEADSEVRRALSGH